MGRDIKNWIRWGVLVAVAFYLYLAVQAQDSRAWSGAFGMLWQWPLLLALVLGGASWVVEAHKWKLLVEPLQPASLGSALRATLVGTSMGIFTPNRTGEWFGRALQTDQGMRARAGLAALLGSTAQTVTTALFGLLALLLVPVVVLSGSIVRDALPTLSIIAGACAVVLLWLYFHPRALHALTSILPLPRSIKQASGHLLRYAPMDRTRFLGWSALRYILFAAQFALLIVVCTGTTDGKSALVAVPIIYLATTLIPTMLLSELGVRGSAAVALLAPAGMSEPGILVACLTMWLMNVVAPAVFGVVLLWAERKEKSGIRTSTVQPA